PPCGPPPCGSIKLDPPYGGPGPEAYSVLLRRVINAIRQVSITPVTYDLYHHSEFLFIAPQHHCSRRARESDAAKDAFLPSQTTHHVLCLALRHIDDTVDAAGLEHLGQVFLWPAANAGNRRAFHRLQTDNLHRRVLFLEVARHAHDGAGGAHGADEVRDGALGLLPDFRARAEVMGLRIIAIGELVEHFALAGRLHRQREIARAFHAFFLSDQDQLGAIGGHRRL